MSEMPLLTHAVVTGVSSNPLLIYVRLPSTQGTGIPVSPSFFGTADDLRIQQHPLPRIGTLGLVAFPYGDARNGVWLASVYPFVGPNAQQNDATAYYRSEWTGEVEMMSGAGDYYHRFPDGSYITLADSTSPPVITRNTVNAQQEKESVAYEDSTRRSGAVDPKPFRFRHSTGAIIDVDGSGNFKLTTPGGNVFEIGDNVDGNPNGLLLAQAFVSAFNQHTHPGNGRPPTVQIQVPNVQSKMIGVTE